MNYINPVTIVLAFTVFFSSCKEIKKQETNSQSTDSVKKPTLPPQQDTSTGRQESSIYAEIDISPMDMSYYPPKYPQQKMAGQVTTPPVMRVIYSRPHLQGRKLFEGVIKYGELWRLGANEATELDIFQPVSIGGKTIKPGRYTLYAIPKAGYWTIVINSDLDMWGLKQDPAMDLVKAQIPVSYYNPRMEYFTIVFQKSETGANLIIAWDDVVASLPVNF